MAIATVIATINGQQYTLTYNSSNSKWESTITAPNETSGSNNNGVGPGVGAAAAGKGYYPVSITATDAATNSTTVNNQTAGSIGQACRLKVLEKVKPVTTITYPTDGSYIDVTKPAFTFTVTDSGSGVNPTSAKIKIDGGVEIPVTLTGSGSTYTGSYTPSVDLSDGIHSFSTYALDYDGNVSDTAVATFTIDTLPPTLSVTTPGDNFVTNKSQITVTGITDDITSKPITVTITVNGVDQGAVIVDNTGNFTKEVSLNEGVNSLVITATDASGKSTSITRNGTLSVIGPTIDSVTITPNPVDAGQTYVLSVTVTDNIPT